MGKLVKKSPGVTQRRNVLTRALGTDAEVKVDLDAVSLEQGDVLAAVQRWTE